MARNSEKAVTALARWRQLQLKEQGKLVVERRPHTVENEFNGKRAEKWRNQVIREIAKKVTQIQNAGLGEFKIRDLNDEINTLLKEKSRWEDRIVELGGPDFKKIGPKLLDREGKEAPGNRGYKYFGAAKDLPGVKELFEQEANAPGRKSKGELLKEVDAEYYGYLDEEDFLLVTQEEKCEKEARKKKIEEFKAKNENSPMETEESQVVVENIYKSKDAKDNDEDEDDDDDAEPFYSEYYDKTKASSKTKNLHIDVPSMKDVEEAILEKKKKELLAKYVSDELLEKEAEVKILSGKI